MAYQGCFPRESLHDLSLPSKLLPYLQQPPDESSSDRNDTTVTPTQPQSASCEPAAARNSSEPESTPPDCQQAAQRTQGNRLLENDSTSAATDTLLSLRIRERASNAAETCSQSMESTPAKRCVSHAVDKLDDDCTVTSLPVGALSALLADRNEDGKDTGNSPRKGVVDRM